MLFLLLVKAESTALSIPFSPAPVPHAADSSPSVNMLRSSTRRLWVGGLYCAREGVESSKAGTRSVRCLLKFNPLIPSIPDREELWNVVSNGPVVSGVSSLPSSSYRSVGAVLVWALRVLYTRHNVA